MAHSVAYDTELTQTTPGGHEAPTMGYDTVFAVSLQGINHAISQSGKFPKKLDWPASGPFDFSMTADFDDWQMVPSGDGAVIHFALPMRNLKAPFVMKGKKGLVTCDEAVAYIAIKLHVQPHTGPAYLPDGSRLGQPPKGTTRHALKVRDTSPDVHDPIVSLVDVIYTKPLSNTDASDPIESMILDWATAHLKDFEHVFAWVDLNDQIDSGKWAWCKPHTSTYAYVDSMDGKTGHLALLSMTSTDPVPPIQQVTNFAIPPGCDSAFLISSRRFMLDMVIPGILDMWPNMKMSDLVVSSDNKRLELKAHTEVVLPQFKAQNGDDYTPTLKYFTVEVQGNEIIVRSQTVVEVSWGIYATCDSTSWFEVAVGKNKKNEQTFSFKKARKSKQIHGHYASPGIKILKEILTIVTIVLAVLSIIVDGGAGLVVAAALLVCLMGQYELSNIGEADKYDAPGFTQMRAAFTGPVTWTSKHLKITDPGLHGALQLGGLFH